MTRYVETFFRHKLLLTAPIVLALCVSIWYATSRAPSYLASTSIWVDTQLPAASSIDAASWNGPTPSAQAQPLLQELVGTRDFDVKAGRRGPLAQYLSTHRRAQSGPTALISRVVPFLKSQNGAASLDDRIVGALHNSVGSVVAGPQVLNVTLVGSDPVVTVGTLESVVAQYLDEINGLRTSRNQASLAYYQQRLTAAGETLSKARTDEVNYLALHPTAASIALVDPAFSALVNAAGGAQTQYDAVKTSYNQANEALTSTGATSSFHVIDPPNGASRVSHAKRKVLAGVAGLFFGVVLSALGLAALTAADTTARRQEDIAGPDGGLEVVATIERFSTSRRARRTGSE